MFSLLRNWRWFNPPRAKAGRAGWQVQNLSSMKEVAPVVQTVVRVMVKQGYSTKDRFGMCLALEEALVNAIKHGHRSDPTKRVHVRYQVDGERTLVEVEDEGSGFDPHTVADPLALENLDRPHGRGLFLMKSYMSWVRFNPRGNRVTLCKFRTSLVSPPLP